MIPALGVCYYPEHWPEDQWAEDAAQMVETGLEWVRIGEFAWSRLEPSSGDFQFEWLDRTIEILGAAGLKIIMGTPTATPPRWMIDKHPDMLGVDVDGRVRRFGSRRHYSFSHMGYRQECHRIVTKLAERYGKNPHVQAWQIDNEYGCHETTHCYSEAALHGFRDWLAQRYQSVDQLNRAWGNVFWSMEYADFDEIEFPNLTVTEPNPAHVMAFRRYSSDQVVAFNKVQTTVLRKYTDTPLIHNYMGRELEFDHFDLGADLDIASWDCYPLGFLNDRLESSDADKARYSRQGDPDNQAFHHDLYRAVGRGRWWVMEQQPGPVNWAPWNPAPLPGMVRLWTLEAIAHGAEAVCYFRWRQAPFGQELYHAGLLRPDSVPTPALAEAAQTAGDIADLGSIEPAQAKVALIFDYAASWAISTQPQGQDFSYFRLVLETYRALRRAGLSIDIVPPTESFEGYALILAPGLTMMSDDLKARLAASNAVCLAGPRAGEKTVEMAIPVPLPPDLPGVATTVSCVESLPPNIDVPLASGGAFVHWFEHLESDEVALLDTADGRPALVGTENLCYLAGWPDVAAWDDIIARLGRAAGLEILSLPDGLRLRDTALYRFAFNYAPEPLVWNSVTVPPAGVAWWPLKDV